MLNCLLMDKFVVKNVDPEDGMGSFGFESCIMWIRRSCL